MTPHLGYLTNWHSLIQSVKLSLSNTLSGGPDHQRWLCRINEQDTVSTPNKHEKHAHIFFFYINILLFFVHKIPEITYHSYQPICYLRSFTSVNVAAARVHRSSFSHNDDTVLETIRLTIKLRRCKGEVKTRKITAKLALRKYVEIKCQHVTVVKRCWKLFVAHSFWDSGLLRHMWQFCAPFVAFVHSYCSVQNLHMERCIYI